MRTRLCMLVAKLAMTAVMMGAWLAMTGPAAAAGDGVAGKRVALVVGQGHYQHVPALDNPPNDARLIAETLTRLGFTLVGGGARIDLDKAAFDRAVQAFGDALLGADVGFFFYAGHGLQVQGVNWLVPVAANPTRQQDLDFQMIDAGLVLRQMDGAGTKLNIVVLDACRNNPFGGRGLRAVESGLAQMRAPEGTLIAYSTQPGNVALDGTGANSPFSEALAGTLTRPGLDVFRLFNQVGLDVKRRTGGQQQPWVSNSPIDGDFFFAAPPVAAPSVAASGSAQVPPPVQWVITTPPPAPPAAADVDLDRLTQDGEAAEGRAEYATAIRLYRQAADAGGAAAQFDLGWAYQSGLGVERDDGQAFLWYRKAADAGHPMAANNLGVLYRNGRGTGRNYAEAMRWYRRAADAGLREAEGNIGVLYAGGLGVPRDDAEAARWFARAADAGDLAAQVNLGLAYKNGAGVARDYGQAALWLRRAADQGSAAGAANLGMLYEQGLGFARDHAQAVRWLRQAAQAGNGFARDMLSSMAD